VTSTRDLCFTPAIELLKLYRARKASPLEVMQEILSRIDAEHDLLITPTTATPPFPLEQPHVNGRPVGKAMQRSYLTYAFSVLGLPAISIPCGFTSQGLPVGLQIVGKRRGETAVLRAAAAFEALQPWAAHVPSIAQRRG
jgi:aspartyl-tRNA(Asn)/glutamyl-tRNA(Gln) amidotransferase subunit A